VPLAVPRLSIGAAVRNPFSVDGVHTERVVYPPALAQPVAQTVRPLNGPVGAREYVA